MTLGEKLLNLRKARGWSQEELADQIGVTRQAVSRWESDAAKPDADRIIALCRIYGISADYLLLEGAAGETGQPTTRGGLSARQLLGILLILTGILTWIALGVLSVVFPCSYFTAKVTFTGLMGFLIVKKMGWLALMATAALIVGVMLLAGRKRMDASREKLLGLARKTLGKNYVPILIAAMAFFLFAVLVLLPWWLG